MLLVMGWNTVIFPKDFCCPVAPYFPPFKVWETISWFTCHTVDGSEIQRSPVDRIPAGLPDFFGESVVSIGHKMFKKHGKPTNSQRNLTLPTTLQAHLLLKCVVLKSRGNKFKHAWCLHQTYTFIQRNSPGIQIIWRKCDKFLRVGRWRKIQPAIQISDHRQIGRVQF